MHDLEQSFSGRAIKRGGLTLFSAGDALVLVDTAKVQGARVLGVETFLATAEAVQPQMDHILDLSEADEQYDTWDQARRFISERSGRGFLFEITL